MKKAQRILDAFLLSCPWHAVWHPACVNLGNTEMSSLVTVMGCVQQGTQALCYRLVALLSGGHVAQSAQRSLQHQRRCARLGSALIVSSRTLVVHPTCEYGPKACVKGGFC